jgi:hypothetical protein
MQLYKKAIQCKRDPRDFKPPHKPFPTGGQQNLPIPASDQAFQRCAEQPRLILVALLTLTNTLYTNLSAQ